MTMLRNDQIQAALVSYIKGKTDITDELTDTDEIREDQWQGTEFSYPNIRVRLISNVPLTNRCAFSKITVSFMVFSEEASSLQVDRIAGIINNTLHETCFVSESVTISLTITNLIPAIRQDRTTWRAEAMFRGIVSG